MTSQSGMTLQSLKILVIFMLQQKVPRATVSGSSFFYIQEYFSQNFYFLRLTRVQSSNVQSIFPDVAKFTLYRGQSVGLDQWPDMGGHHGFHARRLFPP